MSLILAHKDLSLVSGIMSQVSWQVKFHYIASSSLKKVFSTDMRSKNFMFVVRVGVFF